MLFRSQSQTIPEPKLDTIPEPKPVPQPAPKPVVVPVPEVKLPELAQSVSQIKFMVITQARLRQLPSVQSNTLTILKPGQIVEMISTDKEWMQVRFNDQVGWMAREFLQEKK